MVVKSRVAKRRRNDDSDVIREGRRGGSWKMGLFRFCRARYGSSSKCRAQRCSSWSCSVWFQVCRICEEPGDECSFILRCACLIISQKHGKAGIWDVFSCPGQLNKVTLHCRSEPTNNQKCDWQLKQILLLSRWEIHLTKQSEPTEHQRVTLDTSRH